MRGKEYLYKFKNKLPSAVIIAINIMLILLVLNLLSYNFGTFNHSILYTFSIYILLGLLFLNIPSKKIYQAIREKRPEQLQKIYTGFFLIGFSFVIILFTDLQMLWIASVPLMLSGLDLCLKGVYFKRKELYFLSVTSFIYAIFYILLQNISTLWYTIQQISLSWSHVIGSIINKPLLLGPSSSGLWIITSFFTLLIVTLILSPSKKQTIKATLTLIGLFFAWTIYILFLGLTTFEVKSDVINFQYILFLICLIPTYIYTSKYKFKISTTLHFRKINFRKIIKNTSTWALLFLLISTIVLNTFTGAESKGEKLLFYGQNSLGTWDIPEYGKYGREASGMFGLLPIYLSASGYENTIVVDNISNFLNISQPVNANITRFVNLTDYVSFIESPEITSEVLQDFNVFVVTNLNSSFSNVEKEIIWRFIEKGGSLLVLGDHTNVGGIQQPLNDLLKPSEISFRFDSALPLDSKFKWITCYQLFHHPITSNLQSLDELQISVGASLDSPYSIPIIIGRYALSDTGDLTNEEMAFLGDYEYNPGEQIGDIVLAASMHYGNGKVLVFGDTSSFQNAAIAYSILFIQDVFTWLTSDKTQTDELLQLGISLILLIGVVILYFFQKNNRVRFVVFPLVLCIGLLISNSATGLFASETNLEGNIVYIDTSHGERFTFEPFTDESVNGLILNLNRNGYLPLILREFSKENMKQAKILIFNAPTKSFTKDEVEFLSSYIFDGGIVILATGYEDKDASNLLLNEFQLDVEGIPLGPVPYGEANPEEYENEPRFVDSWPIIFNNKDTKSYYNFTWDRDYSLMVFVEHGSGGLLLIGDSQYLLDKNIESIYDYWPGNIIFLKNILDDFKSREEMR